MSKKVGFIGCGNMGSSMVGGLIKSGFLKADEIVVSTKTEASAKKITDELGVESTEKSSTHVNAVDATTYDAQGNYWDSRS